MTHTMATKEIWADTKYGAMDAVQKTSAEIRKRQSKHGTGGQKMANEKPCIYKHTCGFDICMMSDCPYYEPKTKGKKWFEDMEDVEDGK